MSGKTRIPATVVPVASVANGYTYPEFEPWRSVTDIAPGFEIPQDASVAIGATYYAIVDPQFPNALRLAASRDNAYSGNYIPFGPACSTLPGTTPDLLHASAKTGGLCQDHQRHLDDRAAQDAAGNPLRAGYAVTPTQVGNSPGAGVLSRLFASLK